MTESKPGFSFLIFFYGTIFLTILRLLALIAGSLHPLSHPAFFENSRLTVMLKLFIIRSNPF